MKFDFPQFYLLVPGAAAVFLKFVGSSWMNPWFSQVPGIRSERIKGWYFSFYTLSTPSFIKRYSAITTHTILYSLWHFFNVSVIGKSVLPIVNLLLSPH